MGFYIEVPSPKGKAQQLADLHGATILPLRPEAFEDVPEGLALVCVVDNGPFEAVAPGHDQRMETERRISEERRANNG